MIKNSLIVFILLLITFSTGCGGRKYDCEQLLSLNKFKVGQVWNYKNREGEDSSTLTILKIERYDRLSDSIVSVDTIIQIRVDRIKFADPRSATGYSTFVENVPLTETSLLNSVTKLHGQDSILPETNEEYEHWKKLWNKGKTGPFGITVKRILEEYYKQEAYYR